MPVHRIALISDIHGNEMALRRVLDDINRSGVDQIACLGDVATLGPHPREVLEMVRQSCDFCILGNHDEYLFDARGIANHTTSPLVAGAVEQCRSGLTAAEIALVKSFERKMAVPLAGGGDLLLFHGSPDSNDCDLLAETSDAELANHLGAQQAAIMTGGHTHIQMLRQHRGRWLVNPGSVGLAFERFACGGPPTLMAQAEYAILESRDGEVSVTLRRLALDRLELLNAARSWDSPFASYLTGQYEQVGSGKL
jgi:putative phosphoesterase